MEKECVVHGKIIDIPVVKFFQDFVDQKIEREQFISIFSSLE